MARFGENNRRREMIQSRKEKKERRHREGEELEERYGVVSPFLYMKSRGEGERNGREGIRK